MSGSTLFSIGEALIDMIPSKVGCSFDEVPSFSPRTGGAPANVCAAFARLGGKSAFADALRPVQNGFDRRGNGAGCDCVFAHFRTLLSSMLWGRVVPRRLLPCHPQ